MSKRTVKGAGKTKARIYPATYGDHKVVEVRLIHPDFDDRSITLTQGQALDAITLLVKALREHHG